MNNIKVGQHYRYVYSGHIQTKYANQVMRIVAIEKDIVFYKYINIQDVGKKMSRRFEMFFPDFKHLPAYDTPLYKAINQG